MKTIPTRSEVSQNRSLGGKRCCRFPVSVTNDTERKINKLATSCGLSKSELCDQLLRIALDSEPVIEWLQSKYNKHEAYRVNPVRINKQLYY